MKVVLLGGYGHYGRYIARKLVEQEIVTTLVSAGRSLEKARAQAESLGAKVEGAHVDLFQTDEVPEAVRSADLIVNATGPDHLTAVPALRLAIDLAIDYCDLNLSWRATEEMLAMNEDAAAAGITAITGIGAFPGLFSLLVMHGVDRFDQVKNVRLGYCMSVQASFGDPKDPAFQESPASIGSAMAAVIHGFSGTARQFVGGSYVDLPAFGPAYKLPLLGGGAIEVHTQGSAEPITLPRSIPGIEEVTMGAGYYPPQVNDLTKQHIDACGPGAEEEVVAAVRRDLAANPEHWTAELRDDVTKGESVTLEGLKDGRPARCLVEPNWNRDAFAEDASGDVVTGGPLLVACLKLLHGEIATKGVFAPEACFSPGAFFEDLRREVNLFTERDGSLVTEEFGFLD
ncbi:MAG: saccharopine dehydrogenase NADP-binding domain-containing protein [Alphaproteobacteria bacterium]